MNIITIMNNCKPILLDILIASFVILPYLLMISTYFHEQAHVTAALNQNIHMEYNPSIIDIALPVVKVVNNIFSSSFLGGFSSFSSEQDKESYLALDVSQKRSILMAGINSDLILLSSSLLILFTIFIRNTYNAIDRSENLVNKVFRIVFISILLWGSMLIYSTLLNLNTGTGDLSFLLYFK